MMMTKEVMLNILNDSNKMRVLTKIFGKITDIGNVEQIFDDLRENHYIDFELETTEKKNEK